MGEGIVKYKASDGSEVKLSPGIVARYIMTGGTQVDDREVYGFMAKCQARHLNPLAGDAYMTVFGGKASVVVSKDYFVRTATQQPGYDGMKAGVVVITRDGQMVYREGCIVGGQTERLVGGWAEVYDKSRSHPSRAEVSLSEYDTGRSLWKSKPATMIRKVALVQALREAYPGAYGGIYDRDEMPEPDVPVAPPDPVAAPAEVEPAAHEAEQAAYAGDAEAEAIAEAVEPDVYEEDQSW
ncbi:phage recombination protein Bet [Thermophilibacter sp.]|uniref:phage recombination protein Bet n=1 Tax=Thermophilibacter sp. TaxID=2847309 RepID=UPI003A8D6271